MTDTLSQTFEERLQEIETYLDLLEALERQVQTGPPLIGGATITNQQQKILYSCVYLQLYNLVEATVTWCMTRSAPRLLITNAGDRGSENLRHEWIRSKARAYLSELPIQHRLQSAVDLCDHLIVQFQNGK